MQDFGKWGFQLIRCPRKRGGAALVPMLKSLHRGPRGGGASRPQDPRTPGSAIPIPHLNALIALHHEPRQQERES